MEKTIETMPGFKPLHAVQWSTGYGCDVKCGEIVIGGIDENFSNQYRARIVPEYSTQKGHGFTHEYFGDEETALRWIADRWMLWLEELTEPPSIETIVKNVDDLIESISNSSLKKDTCDGELFIKIPLPETGNDNG